MEIVVKEYSKEDLICLLRETLSIDSNPPNHYGLDISKFLREDYSLNLELLEFAIASLINDGADVIEIVNLEWYYKMRGIEFNDDYRREERVFILGFCSSVAQELSNNGDVRIRYYVENLQ